MTGTITFNGKPSTDFGIIVEQYPELTRGTRRGDAYQIAGRNGSYVYEDGTYNNYEQQYSISIPETADDVSSAPYLKTAEVAAWLLGSRGYCKLEDSFEPDCFRMARFSGPLNITQLIDRYGTAPISFECQPERYLKTGETAVTALEGVHALESVSYTLTNPTTFTARPLIKVTGYGGIQFSVTPDGETSVAIRCSVGSTRTTFIIDCDSYSVTYEDGTDASSVMTFVDTQGYPSFPRLDPGDNIVANIPYNGGGYIEKLEIVPRWWKL